MLNFNHQHDNTGRVGASLGIIALIGIALAVFAFSALAATCSGAEVNLGWNANPASEAVQSYRVYCVSSTPKALLGVSDTTNLTVVAEPGEVVTVAAFNGVEGPLSAPLTIPLPPVAETTPEPAMVKVHIYQTDLKTRKVIATVYVARKEEDFFQIGIETP
jgi:hypothetical protein